MVRWWGEQASAAAFLGIHPDGHLLWSSHAATVGAFVEVDMGTEDLPRLAAKLAAYARLAASGGSRYPVLFWLPSRERELNLRSLLISTTATTGTPGSRLPPSPGRTAGVAGMLPVPVATATHDSDPAGQVWLPVHAWRRVRLTDLPSDHGPDTAQNPNWRAGFLDLT